jgi:hypothetical protein
MSPAFVTSPLLQWRTSVVGRRRNSLCAPTACADRQAAGASSEQISSASAVESAALVAAASTMILKRATMPSSVRRPNARTVANALVQLERVQKRNKAKTDIAQLVGQWQLTVTSSESTYKAQRAGIKNPFGRPLYFPLQTRQTFIPDSDPACLETGIFDNAIFALGCVFRVRGPYRWIALANRLEFTASSMSLRVGGLPPFEARNLDGPLGVRTAKTLPFFTFFLARNGVAAARCRSGGVALYTRVPKDQEK